MKYSKERNEKISKSKTHSYESIVERINNIYNGNIIVLERKETYINTKHKILVKCNKCGHEFTVTSNSLLVHHTTCQKCVKNLKHTNESIDKIIKEIYNNDIVRLDDYINNGTPIRFKCNLCGYIWKTKPAHIIEGRKCPHCKQSYLEYYFEKLLKRYNINYICQYSFDWLKDKKHLHLDFYLPDYNIAVECQGIQHFYPVDFSHKLSEEEMNKNFIKGFNRDKLKYNLCKEHNIYVLYFSNLHIKYPYKVYESEQEIINKIYEYKETKS